MKEEIAKELIKKSTVSTSPDFTDKLILKIETEKSSKAIGEVAGITSFRYALLVIFSVVIIIPVLLYLGFMPTFSLWDIKISFNNIPFFIILSILLLLGVKHLLNLHDTLKYYREEWAVK